MKRAYDSNFQLKEEVLAIIERLEKMLIEEGRSLLEEGYDPSDVDSLLHDATDMVANELAIGFSLGKFEQDHDRL